MVEYPTYKRTETKLNPFDLQKIKLNIYENDFMWTLISPRYSINEFFVVFCGRVHKVLNFYPQLIKAF